MKHSPACKRTVTVLATVVLGLTLLLGFSLLLNAHTATAERAIEEASFGETHAILNPTKPADVPAPPVRIHRSSVPPPDFVLTNAGIGMRLTEDLPEVGIWKWNPPGHARPGGVINYGVWYQNNGAVNAEGVVIVDTLPPSTTYAGDNSGFTPDIGAGDVISWDLGDMAPGEGYLFIVTLNVDSSVVSGTSIAENCMTISTTTPGDPEPNNDQTCAGTVDVWDDDVEMHVDKWPSPGDPTPGQEFVYDIQVCNNRGAAAGPLVISDTLPAHTSVASWHHDSPWAVGWQEVNAPTGMFVLMAEGFPGWFCDTIHLRLLLDPDAPQNTTVSNYVQLTIADDVVLENNERLNEDAHVGLPRYDLRLDKTMHTGVLIPGGGINYFIWYGNQGNVAAHIWVTETVPDGLTFEYAHWGGGQTGENEPLPEPTISGDQLVWDLGELPVNGSRWFHVQMAITDTLMPGTSITNCAAVGADSGESTPDDNASCHTVVLNGPGPNLRVTKEHWWNSDGQIGYRVHFWNVGDEAVAPFSITDTLPSNTSWDGWWNTNWDPNRPVTQTLDGNVLAWRFSDIQPGEYANLDFNANLDEPGVAGRWFTNTVEITLPDDDANPADNVYEDVAFSGGEVRRAEMWLGTDHANMWGEGVPGPVTITTPYTQAILWGDPGCNGCWDIGDIGPIWPGDTVIVEAGSGEQPVTILVPDPFDVSADSDTDTVWGQIAGAANQKIQIEGYWPGGHQDIWTNAVGEYSTTYLDIPRGGEGHVRYQTTIDYADVMFHRRFQTADLTMWINCNGDHVLGPYELGHTIWLTITDHSGTVKATAVVSTVSDIGWGSTPGFSVQGNAWSPSNPEILPDDWVYGRVDNDNATSARIGVITGTVDVDNDSVSGRIYAAWFTQTLNVDCHPWGAPGGTPSKQSTAGPDGDPPFSCQWTEWDVQPGQDIGVWYNSDGNWVGDGFRAPYVRLTVDYGHDYVDVNTTPNTVVTLTVVGDDGLATLIAPADGGGYLHSNWYADQWVPARPEIQPGNAVTATAVGLMATVNPVGTINGVVDADANTVSGTIDAPWLAPDLVTVWCEIHEENGQSIRVDAVNPDGGEFFCDFSGLWDVQPGHNVAVNYTEPDGDRVQTHPANPAPHLRIDKWLDGNAVGEGGNAVFHVQYHNQGDAPAEDVVITDTLQGMTYITDTSGFPVTGGGNQIVIALGTVAPGERSHIFVFARIDATAGELVTNTVEIATSNPYDQGDEWEKRSEWSDEVLSNDTHLNVGKWAWTGNPAAGYDVVFAVNTCNNGATASAEVVLTDTLHHSMTLQTWWGQYPGWIEESRSDHELVVSRPTVPGYWCQEIYVVATVDADAWPGMDLWNHAVIAAANDLSPDGDEDWWGGNVSEPYLNLYLDKWWNWGQLVPGGEIRYNIHYQNNGNIPVVGTFRITDTLPVSTTLIAAWRYDLYGNPSEVIPISLADDIIVWEFSELDNGFTNDFEIALRIDPDAIPGTPLHNYAEISCLPGENDCKDNGAGWDEILLDHGPNLRVAKWGDWHDDYAGHAWYQFRVENVGDAPIAQAVITDTYPLLMTMEGGVNTDRGRVADYTENPAEHWFQFTLEDVHPGYRLDFSFNTTMAEPVEPGLALTNTVVAAPVAGDTNPADDSADFTLFTGPMLWVKKGITGEPRPGELITFTLAFGNKQVGHAQWWTLQGHGILTDTLPAGFEYVAAQQHWCGGPDEWCDHGPDDQIGNTLIWQLWDLHPQEWNEIRVIVRVPETATGLDSFINEVAIGSSEPVLDAEWDYGDNIDRLTFEITLPYFEVSKTYVSSRIAGMPVTYTLTVTNIGSLDGTAVVLGDEFPAGFTYTASDGLQVGNSVQWTFATLAKLGGEGHGWFSGVLPCTTGTFTNDDYAVISSAEGITSTVGAPVSFAIVAPTLVADFTASATSVVEGTPIVFTDASTTNGSAIAEWSWDFGDGETSTSQNPTHTYTAPGTYTVTLTVTDGCGFTASHTISVTVTTGARMIYLPLVMRAYP